jgi:phosphopantothenoylcysteine synthetase/decarboxylase
VSGILYVIACGAGPAGELGELVRQALADGWDVYVGSTPAGWEFLDVDGLERLTGHAPRHHWSGRTSGWPPADAVVVAPATINTVDKIAAGITDTWAVSVVVECLGLGVPIVLAPNVNPALGRHPGYRRSVAELRDWGVSVLWHPDGADPPRWMVPWGEMLAALPPRR